MKRIFIITNYFPPEMGAASNRIFHLADGLQKRDFDVSVISPLPNYPNGEIFKKYKGYFKHFSTENNIKIYRLWLYASNSKNKLLRLFAMLSYSFSLIWFFLWHKMPKTIIIQSPPLLVAFTCVFFLRSKKRKLILNVSDLWPIAGLEIGAFKKNFSYKILERIEKFNYKNATLIFGQSEEIITHIYKIYPEKDTLLYRNYPAFEVFAVEEIQSPNEKIRMVYAGLLGIAQGIYKLCEKLDYSNLEFHIYGAGAEKEKIEQFIENNPTLHIVYHGEIRRVELHKALLQYDITIIPLLNRIYGSVPSKIFEYARLGIPMLYFGGGEGETIIMKYDLGWVAKSGNYTDLNKKLLSINANKITLDYKRNIQKSALTFFDFDKQLNDLVTKI